ncbi:MAG: glyoxylate/hydroxypyruvate reductase A [Pseudomonadota bacterium]
MPNVLFAADDRRWAEYEPLLIAACHAAGVTITLARDLPADEVDYIVYAPNSPLQDFAPYTRAKAVLNLWAGVEDVVHNTTLKIPLCRMVEPGMTQGMVEWVMGHVLRHHLGMDAHVLGQDGVWRTETPPLAHQRTVGMLGLGKLGTACATALAGLGFDVAGWARSAKQIDGVATFTGEEGLERVLARSQIIVLLTPLTPQTETLINAARLAAMPQGAVILNPGRGGLIDDAALLAALDTGQIAHATLDAFRVEPLPADHPYWAHPRVTVTPHIASATRKETASQSIAENIRRGEAGEAFQNVVDRGRAY